MTFDREPIIRQFRRLIQNLERRNVCFYGTWDDATLKLMKTNDADERITAVDVFFPRPQGGGHDTKYRTLIGVFWAAVLPQGAPLGDYDEQCLAAARSLTPYQKDIPGLRVTQVVREGQVHLRAIPVPGVTREQWNDLHDYVTKRLQTEEKFAVSDGTLQETFGITHPFWEQMCEFAKGTERNYIANEHWTSSDGEPTEIEYRRC